MNLTIIDAKSHEPLLVLTEDDRGMSVVGGDPKMVHALGLQKFSSLKEVADYINSAGSDVQAVFEGADDQKEGGEENPDMDARIKPAIEMIKALMSKVNERKNRDRVKEDEKKPEKKLVNTSESEILFDPNESIYVSIDGDNIGNAVARAEEMDDEETLMDVSNRINAGQDVMKEWAIRMGGYVVEQGGDEGVLKVPASAFKEIEAMREVYRQAVGATASVGVGRKISESTKARMMAKLKGKNQTYVYEPSTPQELELRLKDQNTTEANKLRTAMRPDESMSQDHPENPKRIDSASPQKPSPEEEQAQEPPSRKKPKPYKGDRLLQARKAQVQQEEEGQRSPKKEKEAKAPPLKREGGKVGSIDHEFVRKALSEKPKEKTGTKYGDPDLDNADYSEHDDPEFVRNIMYLVKHGGRYQK